MDIWVVLDGNGKVTGYSKDDNNYLPKGNLSSDDLEDFEQNFNDYTLEDGKIVKIVNYDDKIKKLQEALAFGMQQSSDLIKENKELKKQIAFLATQINGGTK